MRYLLFISLLFANSSAFSGETIDRTLDADPNGEIHIDIIRGDVDIKTWNKSQVHVEGSLDDASEEFIFKRSGNKTLIKVEIDHGFFSKNWNSDETDITIHIPADSSLHSTGVSTDFDITGVKGGINANSVSGDIDVDEALQEIDIETVSGDVSITDSEGKMQLATVSGDIQAFSNAIHFDATTVSGDVEAEIGLSDLIDLSSVSGDLDMDFELADGGRVDARTVSGDITLSFDNKVVNARFDINTGPGGDIKNSITKDKAESSFIGSENVRFKSGNGDGAVELETMSGTIEIRH